MKQYESKINNHSFDQVDSLISDEAVFWFSDASHLGKDQIRKAFEKTWALIREEKYWLNDLVWIARGDSVASCIYQFNWSGFIDGKPRSGNGRGTTVLRREGDEWKIIHEHLSRFPQV